jgi:hypothetical protein
VRGAGAADYGPFRAPDRSDRGIRRPGCRCCSFRRFALQAPGHPIADYMSDIQRLSAPLVIFTGGISKVAFHSIVRDRNGPARLSSRARDRSVWTILTALAGFSLLPGFLLGEDTSGGAKWDFRVFHWPAAQSFADEPFSLALQQYTSATTPLQHILLGALPWVHDPAAYRLTGFILGVAALVAFGVAVQRRFERIWPDYTMAGLAAAAVALSPGFRSAMFWGDTDALPLLFSALACLLLHDPRTGTWRARASVGRVIGVSLLGAAAFYTRQLYVFVPVLSFWLLWSRQACSRILLLCVFGATAVPALYLFWIWGGLTPPQFHPVSTVESLIYVPTLVAPFALPFLVARRWTGWRWPSKSTLAGVSLALIVLAAVFYGRTLTALGGGIATKVGLQLGPFGVPFVIVVASLGWLAIVKSLISSADNAVLFGFALGPMFLAGFFYQRYIDPLAFTIVLLFASPPLSERIVTQRSIVAGYLFFLGLEVIGLIWFGLLGHVSPNA